MWLTVKEILIATLCPQNLKDISREDILAHQHLNISHSGTNSVGGSFKPWSSLFTQFNGIIQARGSKCWIHECHLSDVSHLIWCLFFMRGKIKKKEKNYSFFPWFHLYLSVERIKMEIILQCHYPTMHKLLVWGTAILWNRASWERISLK